MEKEEYLKIGRAFEIKNKKDRIVFRLLEILPGFLSWGGLIGAVLLSWIFPVWVSMFIIFFVVFWLFRTIYFSFHLWSGYKTMAKYEKIDWMEKLKNLKNGFCPWDEIYHLVVIPMYKEPFEIMAGTFKRLAESDYPKEKMIVVVALEEKARPESESTARAIEAQFGSLFFRFLSVWHPGGVAGEISGKASNETWAVKKAKEKIIDPLNIPPEKIIFSSFDADTSVPKGYFACLCYHYLTLKDPAKNSFQPVPLFINNIWQAPVISRIFSFSSTFWHTMNQVRPEKLVTFSSHSMSFKALLDVGFKQTNVVSDDSRIFWQCFLKYDGDYRVQPLYYPVFMDSNAAKSFWRTLINIYKQQRRWAYGVGDIPYFLFGFLNNKKIPFRKKLYLGFELIGGHFSWATASIMIFFLGWLPLILGGPEFSQTPISYNLPRTISWIMTFSMLGLVGSVYFSLLLIPPKPPNYGKMKYVIFALGWVIFPVMMLFFASLPALDAQTRLMFGRYMGFWPTEKFRGK